MGKKQRKQRVWSPSSMATNLTLDATIKAQIEAKVQELIDKELKPRHVKPPPTNMRFIYLTDIIPK